MSRVAEKSGLERTHLYRKLKALGLPVDAVARFHLGNGARLERVHWLADTSPAGIDSSAGMMANYVYRLDQVEHNHELFVNEHRVIASRQIERLLREGSPEARTPEKASA